MSEKVLGVPIKWSKCFGTNNGIRYEIAVYESELVFVRLASESVGLKWLRKEIERFYFNNPEMEGAKIALKYLLSIAEKEAKKDG